MRLHIKIRQARFHSGARRQVPDVFRVSGQRRIRKLRQCKRKSAHRHVDDRFCPGHGGLHVNGKVRIVANEELLQYADKLPKDVIEEISQEGKKCPERWMMIEVEEAYIQCSKHIPLMKKADKSIDWGIDNMAAKGGDYFQLMDIPLYDRVGGDKAMEVAVDVFYRKVLQDDLVGHFFEGTDMASLRLKQKSFLSMAFGGPYHYSDADLRSAHKPLLEKYGLTDEHFNRILELFKESLDELNISTNEGQGMMEILESTREVILNR